MGEQPIEVARRGNLKRLLDKVLVDRGLDLGQYRERYVERRVAVRLNILGLTTYPRYAAYLDEHPEEYMHLLDALTINVTQFFRDAPTYAALRTHVIPGILELKARRKQRLVRVWSAGCATGEEPYSLAMLLLDGIRMARTDFALPTVIATDIDEKALAIARRGEYPVRELAQIPVSARNRYVQVDGDTFRIRPEVTQIIRFRYLNLFEDEKMTGIDLVVCRNVFIYFNHEDQQRMIEAFWASLARGGYLVLGRSERLPTAFLNRFELIDGRERVYRKPFTPR